MSEPPVPIPDGLQQLLALRPKVEILARDPLHGAVDRELLGVIDQLHAAWDAAVRRADFMERIDALNTMRQANAVARGADAAALALLPSIEARTLRVRLGDGD